MLRSQIAFIVVESKAAGITKKDRISFFDLKTTSELEPELMLVC